MRSPPNPSPTHSQPSLGSLPQAQAGPRSALRGSAGTTPPWAAETGSPGGWRCVEGCGVPAARPPPTLAHPERRAADGAPAAAGRALQRGLGGAAPEPGFPGQPASPAERARGRGPRQGNPISQHRPPSKPAPNFPSGVGEPGAVRGPGKDRGRGPDSTRDPPPGTLSPIPHGQSVPPDPGAAGDASPAREPPRSSPRGAQGGARADSCPRRRPSLRPQTLSLARAASPARV